MGKTVARELEEVNCPSCSTPLKQEVARVHTSFLSGVHIPQMRVVSTCPKCAYWALEFTPEELGDG